eukprot:1225104-Alexandrium_andersonii.AAC.1
MTPNTAVEASQGGKFEVALGPAQFKLRALEAMLYVRQFRLRTLASWSQCWQFLVWSQEAPPGGG